MNQEYSTERLETLVSLMLDQQINEEEWQELEQLLEKHPEAVSHYYKFISVHSLLKRGVSLIPRSNNPSIALGTLHDLSKTTNPSKENASLHLENEQQSGVTRSLFKLKWIAALIGICLIAGLTWYSLTDSDVQVTKTDVAVLLESDRAEWSFEDRGNKSNIENGSPLQSGDTTLSSGIAKLRYLKDMTIVMDARKQPVKVDLNNNKEIRLKEGQLSAHVDTQASEDYKIIVKDVKLSTRQSQLAVKVNKQGTAQLKVFEGQLNASSKSKKTPIKITNQMSIDKSGKIDTAPKTISDLHHLAHFDNAFNSNTPPPMITGNATYLTKSMDLKRKTEDFIIFRECESYRLQNDLSVDAANPRPGMYPEERLLKIKNARIPKGTKINSYLILLAPPKKQGVPYRMEQQAKVTFNKKIIAIIGTDGKLITSHRRLGSSLIKPTKSYGTRDFLTLHNDLKTLTLDWRTPRGSQNSIRVITSN